MKFKRIMQDLMFPLKPIDRKITIDDFEKEFGGNKQKVAIDFQNVDKVYDNGIKAINNLNFGIKAGEFIVLLGPSGCGKTTTLRMIAGLETISSGYIKFNKTTMNAIQAKDRNIAMVFQNYALYPFMSVYKNIAFGLKGKSKSNYQFQQLTRELENANNSNFDKIQDLKAERAIVKTGTAELIDEMLYMKRDRKIASINKEYTRAFELDKTIREMKLRIKYPTEIKSVEELVKLNAEIEELKLPFAAKQLQNRNREIQSTLKLINREFKEDHKSSIAFIKEQKTNAAINKDAEKIKHWTDELENYIKNHETVETKKLEDKVKELETEYGNNLRTVKKMLSGINKVKQQQELKKLTLKRNSLMNKIKLNAIKNNPVKKIDAEISKLKATAKKNPKKVEELLQQRERLLKVWKASIKFRIEKVTNMLGIGMYLQRKPSELSGGQRQRVALARAISKQTGLFLYDEPLSNLDAKLRGKMRIEIRKLHDQFKATSIYVTHDQVEAMSMADKIIVMHKGFIQQVGTPLELMESPANLFVGKFVGNTDINIINVKPSGAREFTTPLGGKIELANKPEIEKIDFEKYNDIVVGVRPEHIIVQKTIVDSHDVNKFEGVVTHKELLGNEYLVQVASKELGNIAMLFPITMEVKMGEKVPFVINPNKSHIYDNKTGYNLLTTLNKDNKTAMKTWQTTESDRIKNQKLLHSQKNKRTWMVNLNLYMRYPFSKSARITILASKVKPNIGQEKVAL